VKLASVLVEYQTFKLDKQFTYYYENLPLLKAGVRVSVRFGHSDVVGLVTNVFSLDITRDEYNQKNGFELQPILEQIDNDAVLTREQLILGETLANNLLVSKMSIYLSMLPPALKVRKRNDVGIRYQTMYSYVSHEGRLNANQQALLDFLKINDNLSKHDIPYTIDTIKTLVKRGNIRTWQQEQYRLDIKSILIEPTYSLNAEQIAAIDKITNSDKKTFLLYGVTGSGKTEVYIKTINNVIENKKTAIVLIPQISLSSQAIKTYQTRLKGKIAIIHSGLSVGERYDQYRQILRGEVDVVIGTRSAIFSPLLNIGLIIIDEEQSSSYKQDTNPRYHAREVALIRASFNPRCKLILGSATPSIDSFSRARKGVYELVELKKRVSDLAMPKVSLVDMNLEKNHNNYSFISSYLEKRLIETKAKNKQALLFINRRGYSPYISCLACGEVLVCPNCKIP
jgi:primosomal protein N' (replication factor Y)